jgi:phosphohistidine phosphatase
MRLYLVHHADAVGPDVDPSRPLSTHGRAGAEGLARRAAERGVKPDVIWHSGKLRARQTAEVFWRTCHPLAEFSATRGLQPDDPPRWIAETLIGESRDIMLVGHMPHLALLLRLLVRGKPEANVPDFPLHGIVELQSTNDPAQDKQTWVEVRRDYS